jgi:hypothetical protein
VSKGFFRLFCSSSGFYLGQKNHFGDVSSGSDGAHRVLPGANEISAGASSMANPFKKYSDLELRYLSHA